MTKLIKYINNKNIDFELKYSIMSEYFENLENILKVTNDIKIINKENDLNFEFFPYIDSYPLDVWSGYYSTRMYLKNLITNVEYYLKSNEILFFIVNFMRDINQDTLILEKIFEKIKIIRFNTWLFSVKQIILIKSIMMQ
jgi:hypothetical protein